MNPNDERRPASSWGSRIPWLIPLVIGFSLGALLFGILPEVRGEFWERDEVRARAGTGVRGQEQESRSDDKRRVAPWAHGRDRHRADRGFGGFFFPFGLGRVLLPLALIGAGAWLLSGRGRRPGGPPATPRQQTTQLSPPAMPTPTEPSRDDPEPPSTGETRRL